MEFGKRVGNTTRLKPAGVEVLHPVTPPRSVVEFGDRWGGVRCSAFFRILMDSTSVRGGVWDGLAGSGWSGVEWDFSAAGENFWTGVWAGAEI